MVKLTKHTKLIQAEKSSDIIFKILGSKTHWMRNYYSKDLVQFYKERISKEGNIWKQNASSRDYWSNIKAYKW